MNLVRSGRLNLCGWIEVVYYRGVDRFAKKMKFPFWRSRHVIDHKISIGTHGLGASRSYR